jgi:hypothetical protein
MRIDIGGFMIKLTEKYIIDGKGQKSAVILPIEEYNELLEDIHDLSVIAERKEDDTISFDEMKKRMK